MLLDSILNALQLRRNSRPVKRGLAGRRPRFEPLEDRCLLSLTAAVNYPVGIAPQAVVAGDFNNDGRLDVATANHGGGSVSLLLGNGQGGFEGAVNFPTGAGPNCMAVGDFNNDGKLDLVTGSETTGKVSVLLGNGSGGFAAPIHSDVDPLSVQPLSIAVGDLRQDGTMDLLVGARYRDPSGEFDDTGEVAVLVGNNTGSFFWGASYGTGVAMPTDIAAVDLNGDSILDIATTWDDDAGAIVVFIRPVTDWFPHFYHTGAHPQSLALGDFTSDGKLDVITAGDTIDVLPGNRHGAFGAPINQPVSGGPLTSVAAADFNADGKLDAVVTNADTGTVSLLLGNGDGAFSATENFAVGSGTNAVVAGDINRDGQRTVADISALLGALADLSAYQSANKLSDLDLLAVADTTGDNMVTNADIQGLIYLLANATVQDARPVDLAMGDFNGDGWLDIATANANTNSVSVLLNDHLWSAVPPGVSVSDATVTEGNTGTVSATFTVTLSKPTNVDVTVRYDTANGTAIVGSDYTASSSTETIPAGQTSRTFTVAVLGDHLAEPTETFAVNLSAPVNATISDGQALGTILDNEPRISINDVSKQEGKGNKTTLFTFTVTLSAAYDEPVTTSYQTVNGTATTADNDYIAKTGTLTFNPGETTKTITIEVKADNKKESNEVFYLDLINSSSNSLLTKFRGIGTILNDD
jgi:hypothetical protein